LGSVSGILECTHSVAVLTDQANFKKITKNDVRVRPKPAWVWVAYWTGPKKLLGFLTEKRLEKGNEWNEFLKDNLFEIKGITVYAEKRNLRGGGNCQRLNFQRLN
jgi:hypothetical protein